LHDTVREIVDENLRVQDAERHSELHWRAARFCEEQAAQFAQAGEKWGEWYKKLMLERLYHLFHVSERDGLKLIAALYDGEARYHIDFLEEIFVDAKQWVPEKWGSRRVSYYEGMFEAWGKWNLARAKELLWALCQELESRSLGLEDTELLADVYHELGAVVYNMGQLDIAIKYLEHAKSLYRETGYNRNGLIWALMSLGGAYLRQGDYTKAIQVYEEAIQQAETNSHLLGELFWRVGDAYRRSGQYDKAFVYISQSVNIFEALGEKEGLGVAEGWMGDVLRSQGRLDEAFQWYSRSLATLQEVDKKFPDNRRVKIQIGNPKYNLARICLLKGDVDNALRYANEARDIWEKFGAEPARYEMLNRLLGRIFHAKGEFARARQYYVESLNLLESARWVDHKIDTLLYLTMLDYDEGKAPSHLDELEKLMLEHGSWSQLAWLKMVQGNVSMNDAKLARTDEEHVELLEDAFAKYSKAIVWALQCNRYVLDELLEKIIAKCMEYGVVDGQTMLERLKEFWRTGAFEGETLIELERKAREREKGNGSPQKTVVKRIEEALKNRGAG